MREMESRKILTLDRIIGTELDPIVSLYLDDVGQQVPPLERQVLNDQVKRIIRVFDTRDRDIPNLFVGVVSGEWGGSKCDKTYLLDELRGDDSSDIVPQVRLKLEMAIRVEQEVLRKPSPVVPKAFVELNQKKK
jgi:hypothetical protein